jgi:CTP:molybdopterin cytidylyltransferase MocA
VSVAAVVLAAGGSTRLGRPKQLVEHAGEPLVRRAARAAREAGADPVLVVLGAHADAVARALTGLDGVTTLVHADWARGMAGSLAAGVRAALAAAPACDAILVTLADQPLVDAAALRRLLAAFPGAHALAAAAYGDPPGAVLGVPAVFGRAHLDALLAVDGDAGAGGWLRRHRERVVAVPIPEATLDVDTADDLARLAARGASGAEAPGEARR